MFTDLQLSRLRHDAVMVDARKRSLVWIWSWRFMGETRNHRIDFSGGVQEH